MKIKAFLGHSFTDDDRELVGKVTEFLDAQKVGHPEFEWVHATQAKPMSVADKVLPLIRESDIFIGLCTRKERFISPGDLWSSWWRSGVLHARSEKIGWKTSDWIIQEIGIAIQRDMELILLVEEGVREPGGLIGDLEYIPFSRENLAPAFTRLAQMLGGAILKSSSSLGVSNPPSQKSVGQEQSPDVEANDADFEEPQISWDIHAYENALFTGILMGRKDYEERVSKAFLESPLGKVGISSDKWHATREHLQLLFDKGGKFSRLEELVNKNRSDPEMLGMLASANLHLGNQDIGASLYEEAANAAANDGSMLRQAGLFLSAIHAYLKIGRLGDAEQVEAKLHALKPLSPELEAIMLKAAAAIAESQKQNEIRIAALERKVALNPTDVDDRFALAYLYGEVEDHESSLLHYLAIPADKRSSGTWNNLGVARERLKLKVRAVDAYRKAEALGDTLAMSNLAQGFISAGFAKEGEDLCNAALARKEYDQRIPEVLARLKADTKEEADKEEELVQKTAPRSRFFRDAGQSITQSLSQTLASLWSGPTCLLTLSVENSRVKLRGEYEVKAGGIMLALGAIDSAPRKFIVTYEGFVRGRVFFVQVQRKQVGEVKSSSLFGESKPDIAVMIVSEDQRKIKVMENIGVNAKFYDIEVV